MSDKTPRPTPRPTPRQALRQALRQAPGRRRFLGVLAGAALLALAGTALAADDEPAGAKAETDFPEGIGTRYAELSGAIRVADMRTFMQLFHLDYLVESPDGRTQDRGPWRRLWLRHFDEWDYETVAYELDRVEERDGDRQTVRVRRVVVRAKKRGRARELQERFQTDTWIHEDGQWSLIFRVEEEPEIAGRLGGTGRGEIDSPRIRALAEAIAGGDEEALGAFWSHVSENGTPLVEAAAGDEESRWVTYVWKGDRRELTVHVRGGAASRDRFKPLQRIAGTNLWFRSERIPAAARFTYELQIQKSVRAPAFGKQAAEDFVVRTTSLDPLNPRKLDGLSYVSLPSAPGVEWTLPVEGRPAGSVERQQIRSDLLGERRFVSVYTPPDYTAEGTPLKAVYVLDQGSYASRRATGVVLDNLIFHKELPPTVVFMIHSEGSQRPELEISAELTRFLGEELVAWSREEYNVSEQRADCVIGGQGIGGALAAICALEYPKVYSAVLSASGDFAPGVDPSDDGPTTSGDPEAIVGEFKSTEKRPLEFYLLLAELESPSTVASNRHLRDVLEARGYTVTYSTLSGNQHSVAWFTALRDGLKKLLR